MYEYRCTIVRWVDGDTAEVEVDLGFHVRTKLFVRLDGMDAPELHSPDPAKRVLAQISKTRAAELCPVLSVQSVRTAKARTDDKYGRWVATITRTDGRDFATTMILEGHAVPYGGGKR